MTEVKDRVREAIEQEMAGTDLFLVDIKVSPAKIIVLIDKPAGVTIAECINLTRRLHELFNDSDIFEKHELEVSSPGMEEPLKVLKQYEKRIGREVRVMTSNGEMKKGILKAATAEEVELEERIEKKVERKKIVETNYLHIPFNQIKETKVIFSFR